MARELGSHIHFSIPFLRRNAQDSQPQPDPVPGGTKIAQEQWPKSEKMTSNALKAVRVKSGSPLSPEAERLVFPFLRARFMGPLMAQGSYHVHPHGALIHDLEAVNDKCRKDCRQQALLVFGEDGDSISAAESYSNEIAQRLYGIKSLKPKNIILTLGTLHTDLGKLIEEAKLKRQS